MAFKHVHMTYANVYLILSYGFRLKIKTFKMAKCTIKYYISWNSQNQLLTQPNLELLLSHANCHETFAHEELISERFLLIVHFLTQQDIQYHSIKL